MKVAEIKKKMNEEVAKVVEEYFDPPETEAGIPVIARGEKKPSGKTTGHTKRCTMEGCSGIRVHVKWDDGHYTWPCSKGMNRSAKHWRII